MPCARMRSRRRRRAMAPCQELSRAGEYGAQFAGLALAIELGDDTPLNPTRTGEALDKPTVAAEAGHRELQTLRSRPARDPARRRCPSRRRGPRSPTGPRPAT